MPDRVSRRTEGTQSKNCRRRVARCSAFRAALSRKDAVGKGERDRPGRSFRRLAEKLVRQIPLTVRRARASAASPSTGRRRERSRRPRSPSPTAWFRLRRHPWAVAATLWVLLLGTMIAVVWYARLHPARDENWALTWKNGLGRALFLTLTLGGFYLYNRLSTNRPHPTPPRRG